MAKPALKLERAYLDNCTIGKLFFRGERVCYTVECPWLNNGKNISCIPAGTYRIEPHHSSKYPDCYSLTSFPLGVGLVPQFHRTHILIHPGNFPYEVEGCIAPGLKLHPSTWGVSGSRDAMDVLRGIIEPGKIDILEIK